MWQNQPSNSSFSDSVKALQDDIQHANTLTTYKENHLFMSQFSIGLLNFVVQVYADGMPSISSKERKATIKEFYAVIYPSLRLLQGEFNNDQRNSCVEVSRKRLAKVLNKDLEGDEECGICMENGMKMVLPNCGHSLCISCFHDWYMRSESCPFCRGSLKRISPKDLWVVIGNSDVVDRITIAKENLRRLYHYIETLPSIISDAHAYTFNHML
ncbi:hypothetical protein JHK84_048920 [Glycine max]|nr:hypothetical protein JHK84_048920 [Glycine max]